MKARHSRDEPDYARLAVDRVPSMLAYWDAEQRCRFANNAYSTWFGVGPDWVVGRTMRELLGPDLYALNLPHIQGALAGEEQHFERMVPGPGGQHRHSLASYLPHRVDGRVAGFFVQVTEVTRLKETEAALQHEQTLRLHLEAHARELDALLRERGEMLDLIAHEVRQPLHNAAAVLQQAAAAIGTDRRMQQSLARAQAVLAQVNASVDNTLAVAGLVARAEAVRRVDTDLELLVAIAIGDVAAAQRARVHVQHREGPKSAAVDSGLMRLALRNLIGNALRYSPEGSAVDVTIGPGPEPGSVAIDVADRGHGIEAELLPRLFERGARGRMPAGAPAGHGLGLYIARRVMELHGGRIELLRNTRRGATMRLVIGPP
ncbi:MAG: PAS domain-containing protein [Rubrivivax sp.]